LDVEGIVKAQGFYGEYNQNNAILNDVLNGNVTLSALGGSIYMGYQNTTKLIQRADLYDTTGAKVLLTKDGVFKGTIQLPASVYASQGGGLDVNNSDILGLNNVYFNDTCTSDSEAIQFKRTNTPVDSVDPAEHDSFRIFDGTGYLNGKPIFTSDSEVLWSGGYYMAEGQSVTPTKALSKCPNGWVLVWSEYDGATSQQFDYNFTIVHKHILNTGGTGVWSIIGTTWDSVNGKYCYFTDTLITGHDKNNDAGARSNATLRHVLAW
jgi:hypothetical protein